MISIKDGQINIPVGEQFNREGTIVEAYSSGDDCKGCVFGDNCDRDLACNDHERADKTNVKFKKV